MSGSPPMKKPKEDISTEIQETVDEIDSIQSAIDGLNEKASEEILSIEQKYSKLRQPYYERRSSLLKEIPDFWFTTFMNHPKLSAMINEEDELCLQHLTNVQVKDADSIYDGFNISLEFSTNPFFENKTLVKSFRVGDHGVPTSSSTAIQWKDGKNLTGNTSNGKPHVQESFFLWFLDNENAAIDDIAEIIKDDIWLNPLQYFLMPKIEVDSTAEDDEENDEEDEEEDDDDEAVEDEEANTDNN